MDWLTDPTTLVELVLTLLLVGVAVALPGRARKPVGFIDRFSTLLPTSIGGQMLLVAALATIPRAALLPWLGVPPPLIHDEHSLLLQAETFLRGNLAMPPHPFGGHFETFHVNQWPSYASIYFPGRSFPLLLGLLLFGHAWPGVWLIFVALACATVWMLRAWVGPRLALLGGMLVVVRLGLFSYWINSYWGGSFTALGAVLVLGALPRLLERPRWLDGLWLGTGVLIMMTARPFEGFVLCLALAATHVPRLLRAGGEWFRLAGLKGGVPLIVSLAIGLTTLGAYNEATTGRWLTTPYKINRLGYAIAPAFLFEAPIASEARFAGKPEHLRRFYQDEAKPYRQAHSGVKGLVASVVSKIRSMWFFYVGFALTIPLLAGLWRSRRDPVVWPSLLLFIAGFSLTSWAYPHYAAPAMPLVMILIMRGFGALAAGSHRGAFLARTLPFAAAVPLAVPVMNVVTGAPALEHNSWNRPCCTLRTRTFRTGIVGTLENLPGRKLVLVETNEFRPIHEETVFNGPEIDAQRIVWAHSLGEERDGRLLRHFADRNVWRLHWTGENTYRLKRIR